MTSAFSNRFTGPSCKAASSFPPQQPARVRVQVDRSRPSSNCPRAKNQSPGWFGILDSPEARVFMSDTERKHETPNVLVARHAVRFSRLPLNTRTAQNAARQVRGLLALAVVLLLLLEPGTLFGQQTWPGNQGWSQSDRYIGQYAPNQQSEYGQQPDAQPSYLDSGRAYPQQGYGQAPAQAQPLNAAQLEQLVAPIALYPDALVAQVLAASTYPAQVADADHWRQTQGYASPDQVAAGADVQNWDPSVKALTAFPQVLARWNAICNGPPIWAMPTTTSRKTYLRQSR